MAFTSRWLPRGRLVLALAVFAGLGTSSIAAAQESAEAALPSESGVAVAVSVVEPSSVSSEGLILPQPARLFSSQALTFALDQDPQTQKPAEPEHSGWGSLLHSTARDFIAFPKRKSTWVILGVGGGAAGIAYPFDDELNEEMTESDGLRNFFKPGKYLGYAWVQGSAAVGLYLVGRYAMKPGENGRTNKISHLGFDLIRANLLTQAFTYGIKYAVRRDRPTGECCSFPSGHASVTFATASVIERHFGARASWPMFLISGYVSASRLTDNRHFLSDVLFGSALGMASGWTVVGRHGRENFTLLPVPTKGGVAISGSWTPGAHDHAGG